MCNRVPTDPGYEIVPRAPRSAAGPGGRQGIFSMYVIMMYMLESCCIYWNLDIYITNLDIYICPDLIKGASPDPSLKADEVGLQANSVREF